MRQKEIEEQIDYNLYSVGELQEIISIMEDNIIDKRKKEYKEYIKVMNLIFDIYNKKVNSKIYKKI